MPLKELSTLELTAVSGGCDLNCQHRAEQAKTAEERQQIIEDHIGFCLFG